MTSSFVWMLDTNTLSAVIKRPDSEAAKRMVAVEPGTLCTSMIVACELRFGAARRGSTTLSKRVDDLLAAIPPLAFDGEADRHYADIRHALESVGQPIGSHDTFIAAHARALDLTLVTHNTREFARVPGLRIENWVVPLP